MKRNGRNGGREKKLNTFDAVELMLQENLSAQINYSMVKSIAGAIDKKVQILSLAQSQYSTKENILQVNSVLLW